MEKTTVYLATEQKVALAAAAREQGRSEARLIRDGIDGVLSRHATRETPTTLAGAKPTGAQPADVTTVGDPFERPRWLSRAAFIRQFGGALADAALAAELRELAPDLTDELPDP